MLFKTLIVLAPILIASISTIFWLSFWGVLKWNDGVLPGLPSVENTQDWEDSGIVPEHRPPGGYPVFTVRTLAVNALEKIGKSDIKELVLTDSIAASQEIKNAKNIRHISIAP